MAEDEEKRFTDIYTTCYPRVLAYARRRVRDAVARDAVDEAFLIAWRKLAQVPEEPMPWLLVTTRNVLRELRREGERYDVLLGEAAQAQRLAESSTSAAEATAVERMTVLRALGSLREQDREVLMLTVWDGLTQAQAAHVLGCSSSAFAVRHHRARRRLVTALDEYDTHSTRRTPTNPSRIGPVK